MNHINKFEIIQLLKKFNDIIQLYLAEDKNGNQVEILLIKTPKNQKSYVDRILKYEIEPVRNETIPLVQKVIQFGYDEKNNVHFIVYEHNNNELANEPTLDNLIKVLETLKHLKNLNKYGFYISSSSILINTDQPEIKFLGLLKIFILFNAVDSNCLAPEFKKTNTPSFQSDMYAVFTRFKDILDHHDDNLLHEIFEKALASNKIERFSSYQDVIEKLKELQKKSQNNSANNSTIKIIVKDELKEDFKPILEEINEQCYLFIDNEKSENGNNVQGQFSTENHSGNFFVNSDNSIFIMADKIKSHKKDYVVDNGFLCEYKFSYEPLNRFDSLEFFESKWEELTELNTLHRKETNFIKKWQTLPEKERECIEEKAFKATYSSCREDKVNPSNIIFQLSKDQRDSYKLRELKKNEVKLVIDDKIIGIINHYREKSYELIIKDADLSIDEIPTEGELIEDVGLETSQFKKQVEACEKFAKRDVVNPELYSMLTAPQKIIPPAQVNLDYLNFESMLFNSRLKSDESQLEAVLEALHTKPLYLIQGPPGTGKTTVIVELVEQLIRKNNNVKILVTSQSNLAVDNVLERLPDSILYMRLASNEDRISESIKMHSFSNKLSNWIENTKVTSTDYLATKLNNSKSDIKILKFKTTLSDTGKNKKFSDFQNLLRFQGNHIKRTFKNAKNITEVNKIFNKHLDPKASKLKAIQREWFAFLGNADTDSGKQKVSMLNDGSAEVDLNKALLKSTNVIGATCIHIASGQYGNVDFKFDYVIMDESSKATPPESLVPINMAKNVIMIGDHKQLPPVITRERAVKDKIQEELDDNGLDVQKEFGESLFEKLFTVFEENDHLSQYVKMLAIQYRMPRQLGNLISTHFYRENPLKNPDESNIPNYDALKSHELSFKKPRIKIKDVVSKKLIEVPTSVIMVSTSNKDNPYDNDNKKKRANETNRDTILDILSELNKQYKGNTEKEHPFTIGIIAGYRGQVELLEKTINTLKYPNFKTTDSEEKETALIEINTVDKFQGAERDIIIYDIVKSSQNASNIGFLDDYRRINVAFSRAKRLLIIVGDSNYILKRAHLSPKSEFEDFKLKEIIQELQDQSLITPNLKDILQ